MQISLENVGKKFNRDWTIRQATFTFVRGGSYVITGPNGSGKSTLLQMIAGLLPVTEGVIRYAESEKPLAAELVFNRLTIAAPYLELIEEFTLAELLQFHRRFKPLRGGVSDGDFLEITALLTSRHKAVRHFSSGMKTRVKLGLAFLSDVPLLLLDEPTSNLDAAGVSWYQQMLRTHSEGRTVIICSNQPYEYEQVSNILLIRNAKLELNSQPV
jgi:ABC-type multidrug transport system ATPase subunit